MNEYSPEIVILDVTETVGNSPIIELPDLMVSPGEALSFPAVVYNFQNIGAVSLTLNYDPSALNFQSYANTSGFPGLIVFSPVPGTIVVAGFNLLPDGFSIADGLPLLTLSFLYQEGSSLLTWIDDGSSCEFAGPTPDYLPLNDLPTSIFYQNGSVNVANQYLEGTVSLYSYANPAIPVEGFTVDLRDENENILATTVTNSDGSYEFSSIPVETAYLHVSSPLSWRGVNATDALAVEKHSIGHPLQFWYPDLFINKVADVNNSGFHNSTDALAIMQRSIQLIPTFDAGNWVFYNDGVVFENTGPGSAQITFTGQSQINIFALCVGDVNGSGGLQSDVSSPQVKTTKIIKVNPRKTFSLPVILSSEDLIGALTIALKYDNRLIHVHGIRSAIPNLMYHLQENYIRVVWQEQDEPLDLSKDGSLFNIIAQLNAPYVKNQHLFEIDSKTEFADPDCNVIEGISVTIPGIDQSTDLNTENNILFSHRCFPNPCKHTLIVDYFLHRDANTSIIIKNLYGRTVIHKSLGRKSQGQHHVKLDLRSYGLEEGIYHLNLIAEGVKTYSSKPERFILIKE